ncbi:MAG TPA: DoxX family protein [Saprospiraceae bacterium]|nr:DoxX family protein [Saprospiraceae bacterium]MCB9270037.1 DoxX family protein [Lewinellaceae bacterium]HPG08454.1 DoxX family protein [Saprospiraceae bacterium]HPQ99873.1 DoxX family protein [Saprospiraceae bacterium]HQU51532.1 DoxX family protein [Saprospiraceae bacterium]
MQLKNILEWVLRIVLALILIQTLFFKFTGAPESIYIFEKTGLGTPGRLGSGIAELIASILLLVPKWKSYGALLAFGAMSGAIFFHLTTLGIDVMGDGGTLFYLACLVWTGSLYLLIRYRNEWIPKQFLSAKKQ